MKPNSFLFVELLRVFHQTHARYTIIYSYSNNFFISNKVMYDNTNICVKYVIIIINILRYHIKFQKRIIIDRAFQNLYTRIVKAKPDIKDKIGEFHQPKNLDLKLEIFPCYRSILNKITESCFSLPQVRDLIKISLKKKLIIHIYFRIKMITSFCLHQERLIFWKPMSFS